MPVIKRYANRKLYDTHAKQYVTLDNLAGLVRRGLDVSVVDHVSGEDITIITLAQIIVEQEKTLHSGLPRTVFTSMIRATSQAMNQLRGVLPWTAGGQPQTDTEIERRIEILVSGGQLTRAAGKRLAQQMAAAGEAAHAEPLLDEVAVGHRLRERGTPTREEIQVLAKQLAALQDQLERLAERKCGQPG